MQGGELFDRVVDPKFDLTERVAILFMRQIADGMAFIHAHNIIHLDMKVGLYTVVQLVTILRTVTAKLQLLQGLT